MQEYYDQSGFLQAVKNPKGKKGNAYIFQGMRAGFSAAYVSGSKPIKTGYSRSAEGLARKLAKKGHKVVTFRD